MQPCFTRWHAHAGSWASISSSTSLMSSTGQRQYPRRNLRTYRNTGNYCLTDGRHYSQQGVTADTLTPYPYTLTANGRVMGGKTGGRTGGMTGGMKIEESLYLKSFRLSDGRDGHFFTYSVKYLFLLDTICLRSWTTHRERLLSEY